MIIDVSKILKETGGKIDIDSEINFSDVDFLGESFHFDKPLELVGKIYNNGKSLRLEALAKGEVNVHCARCLMPITENLEFLVEEDFMQESEETCDEDIILFSGNKIDLDEIVSNSFFMNVQGKYLCSEDCKGLCLKCGQNLNLGDCDCEDDNIDPRWESLKAIMNNTDN